MLSKVTHVDFPLYERYEKTAHLNRTVISGANGLIKLNIPVTGGRGQRLPISEVTVAYAESWRRIHLRSIVSSYKRSPWFDHYHDYLAEFYKSDFEFLWEWNLTSMEWIARVLKLDLQIEKNFSPDPAQPLSESFHQDVDSNSITDFHWRPYSQVFADRFGFIPGLSILDTLFCLGPKSTREYITGGSPYHNKF